MGLIIGLSLSIILGLLLKPKQKQVKVTKRRKKGGKRRVRVYRYKIA